jgi:hypothetical protein
MYQKSQAKIEGTANTGIIRLDNNAGLIAEKLQIKSINITAEQSADTSVYADKEIVINASGNWLDCTEVQIELKQFDDEAKLLKKNNQTATGNNKAHFQLENGTFFYNK